MHRFFGTSYLGLDRHPAYLELVKEGLDKFGTHYGGSRLSPKSPQIFEEAEQALADWVGAPAALVLSSGTTAGQLAARYLSTRYQSVHFSPRAHPASWWPVGKQYQDWETWLHALQQGKTIGCTDGIDPLGIELPPWKMMLASAPPALMIDDSHLLGCYGENQAGNWEQISSQYTGDLMINSSLGKALALPAGVLFGERADLEQVKSLPQFGGASPPAPAFLYAWLRSSELIREQNMKLKERVDKLYALAARYPRFLQMVPGFPVARVLPEHWVTKLHGAGIAISSFRYPHPDADLYSRIVLRADHTTEAVDYLIVQLELLIAEELAG